MRYISLFTGIGCADVAWMPLDWEPLAFSEIDPFASAVLSARFPGVPNVGDVTAHDWSAYRGRCDLVIGGSPCQAFSVAGLRKSLSDRRGNLTLAFVEACHAIDPGIVVWENVPGVQSTPDNAFGCFLAGLVGASEPLSSGHRRGRWPDAGMVIGPQRAAAWGLLDSQHFGVPQRRKRLFLVAVALSHPAFAPGLRRHPSAGGAAGEEVVGALASRATGGGGLGTDFECSGGLQPVPTLMASDAGTERPAGLPCEAEYCVPMADGLPAVSGTLGGGSGARGYNNGLDLAGAFIPVPVPSDAARCLSTRVDRQNDTQETMVVLR